MLAFKLLIAALVGAVVGLQRESKGEGDSAGSAGGIRTFALVGLFGGIAGFFYSQNLQTLFIFLAAFITLLVLIYYVMGTSITKRAGLTNEISILYTFLIGFLFTTGLMPTSIVVALSVVLVLILSLKAKTKKLVLGISSTELEAFITYAIIALVVLPFLPNRAITIADIPFIQTFLQGYSVDLGQWATLEIFNPRKIGLIVALVTGIDVFGYLLGKVFGNKKSFTLTSFIGGFISSTSTTQALAQKSKKGTMINALVGAALLANMASFFQVFLLVAPLNSQWLVSITPMLLIIIAVSFIFSFLYLFGKKQDKNSKETDGKKGAIFSLMPALKFAGLLILVKIVTKVCLILFGNSGFIVSSVIASLVGIDAIVLNLADMAGKLITFKTALFTLILVNATNLLAKSVFVFLQGDRRFAWRFLWAVLAIIGASFLGLLFVS